MSEAVPIILCGQRLQIASVVIAALKPEYEVIHVILTPEAGQAEIPLILNRKSSPSACDLGSGNYSKLPAAVVLGGGYDDDNATAMMKACKAASTPEVPWLRPDTSKPAPPLGPEYGKALVARLKTTMGEMTQKEKLGIGNNGIFWY